MKNNRKIILLFALSFICFNVAAQKATVRSFFDIQEKVIARWNEGSNSNPKAFAKDFEMLATEYNKLPAAVRDSINIGVAANIFYNAACGACLTGRNKKALKYLATAVDKGWGSAAHTRQDPDLAPLHGNSEFERLVTAMEENSYLGILKKAGGYTDEPNAGISFTYATPNDSNLVRTRRYFNLDSITGSGDEISKIKNLMYFVHDAVRHDGSSDWPKKRDAISLYEVCKKENRGINCRMMAIMLNEIYLAMGWKSRYVTCLPADSTDSDCHVINIVFSNTLDKWIWMDPTFAAYVSDENGTLLDIDEVRERLIDGRTLVLNEDANWNHQNRTTKSNYLDEYMAKNLYIILCADEYRFGNESTFTPKKWLTLTTKGHEMNWITRRSGYSVTTNNKLFWQSPY